jgi:serine/threonine-protein phosphatase 2A regulatory subunit B
MDTKPEEKKSNEDLKILEWRFNQFLGEKLTYDQIKQDPENESFIVTNCKFSPDGNFVVVSDKGGRIIIFKKNDSKTVKQTEGEKESEKIKRYPKLDYFYEFPAHEKDFDIHKSIEYPEEIKCLSILPSISYNKLDIITAGYRTIKLDRIFKDKIKVFDQNNSNGKESKLNIPKISYIKSEIKHKTKRQFICSHSNEINSVSDNKINRNSFISSDDYKVLLWDLNITNEVFNIVDIDPQSQCLETENPEKITKSIFSDNNPHLFCYGTNKGNIKYCDTRSSSDHLLFTKNIRDENSNLSKTIFANSLLSVHDICMNFSNNYTIATRHYLSVNLWDIRKEKEPTNKFLLYEPIINKLSYLYQNNYLNDKFSLSSDKDGKYMLTGGYNNMFHVIDVEQRLNTQIVIDDSNEKIMNTNVIRKINSKGCCFYKKEDPNVSNIDFDKRIVCHAFSPVENYSMLINLNCIYSYSGAITKKDGSGAKKDATNKGEKKK